MPPLNTLLSAQYIPIVSLISSRSGLGTIFIVSTTSLMGLNVFYAVWERGTTQRLRLLDTLGSKEVKRKTQTC